MILLQHADGTWNLDSNLASILCIDLEELKKKKEELEDTIWGTCLSLVWLEKYQMEKKDVWELLYEKGFQFLCEKVKDPNPYLQKAKKMFH